MFVKFGQIASTRSDLLADPVVDELSRLCARSVRPIPAEQVRPLVEQELGRPVEEVFASFEFEPLAAASIGQAHRATLASGESVVVKIQRPGLDDLLRRDATVLRLAARMAERRIAGGGRLRCPRAGRGAHRQHGPRAGLPARGHHVRPAAGSPCRTRTPPTT